MRLATLPAYGPEREEQLSGLTVCRLRGAFFEVDNRVQSIDEPSDPA